LKLKAGRLGVTDSGRVFSPLQAVAELFLECLGEGFLRAIAGGLCDLSDRAVAAVETLIGSGHGPVSEILHRGHLHQIAKMLANAVWGSEKALKEIKAVKNLRLIKAPRYHYEVPGSCLRMF
jgi:hypothetical protein